MSSLIYSCSKDLTSESPVKESNTNQPSQTQSSTNATLNQNNSYNPITGRILYSYFKTQIIANGYTEIALPANYVPHINVGQYNGATLHLFFSANNQRKYYEVYVFTNEISASAAAAASGCDHKATATKDGESCQDTGNECTFNDTDGIICCSE